MEAENALRRSSGHTPLIDALALHFGEAAYGNVGAPHRLDFTVIGPAVNRASRLLELAKRLNRHVASSCGKIEQRVHETDFTCRALP